MYSRIQINDCYTYYTISFDKGEEQKVLQTNNNIKWVKTNIREKLTYNENELYDDGYDKVICIYDYWILYITPHNDKITKITPTKNIIGVSNGKIVNHPNTFAVFLTIILDGSIYSYG